METSLGRTIKVLPINPNQLNVNGSRRIDLVDMIGSRQVSIVGPDKLKVLEFSSFFPATHDVYPQVPGLEGGMTPGAWINFLQQEIAQRSFKLFISTVFTQTSSTFRRSDPQHIFQCVIQEFNWRYQGGWGNDIAYDLRLSEYHRTGVRVMSLESLSPLPGNVTIPREEKEKPLTVHVEDLNQNPTRDINKLVILARKYDEPLEDIKKLNEWITNVESNFPIGLWSQFIKYNGVLLDDIPDLSTVEIRNMIDTTVRSYGWYYLSKGNVSVEDIIRTLESIFAIRNRPTGGLYFGIPRNVVNADVWLRFLYDHILGTMQIIEQGESDVQSFEDTKLGMFVSGQVN